MSFIVLLLWCAVLQPHLGSCSIYTEGPFENIAKCRDYTKWLTDSRREEHLIWVDCKEKIR